MAGSVVQPPATLAQVTSLNWRTGDCSAEHCGRCLEALTRWRQAGVSGLAVYQAIRGGGLAGGLPATLDAKAPRVLGPQL